MSEFKIGIGDTGRQMAYEKDGGPGVVITKSSNHDWNVKLDGMKELILEKDLVYKGFQQLKAISLQSVRELGPCEGDWDSFFRYIANKKYGWTDSIKLEDCIGVEVSWDAWFIDKKFIEQEKKGVVVDQNFIRNNVQVRCNGEFKDQAICLSMYYNWTLEVDEEGATCLVPHEK